MKEGEPLDTPSIRVLLSSKEIIATRQTLEHFFFKTLSRLIMP